MRKAIDQTWGEVLTYDGKICDARFSKCCGGMTERFASCWENVDYPYLAALPDAPSGEPVPDLTDEAEAERWIMGENSEENGTRTGSVRTVCTAARRFPRCMRAWRICG